MGPSSAHRAASLSGLCLLTVLVGLLLGGAASVPAKVSRTAAFDPTAEAEVAQIAKAGLTGGITGITVGINDPSLGHLVRSYGSSDTRGTPLTPDMHYRIASVSKTFTADAVLHLIEQGRISFADPISKYVAGVPKGNQITIRDLLAMRGGVWDFTNDAGFIARYLANPTLRWTPADTLRLIHDNPEKASTPNVKTVYSNSEYVLLGYVIRKASGESPRRYITSLIHSLRLRQTSFPVGARLPRPYVHGYLGAGTSSAPTTGNPQRDMTLSNPLVPWTAGSMISTVPDMLAYARELGTGAGLSRAVFKLRQDWGPLTTTGPKLQYGLGITQLGEWIGHDGSIFGYSDMVFYLPAKHVSVVVMANAGDGNNVPAQAVWGAIAKHLYPGSITSWPTPSLSTPRRRLQ